MTTRIVGSLVEVIVFRFMHDRPEYLLLKRSGDLSLYPNIWQIVTGWIEPGEKAFEAALREVREETGLRPARFWSVPYVGSFYDPDQDTLNLCPLFAVQVEPGVEPELSKEHTASAWVALGEAIRRVVWPGQKEGLEVFHRQIVSGGEGSDLTRIDLPGK